MAKMGIMLHPSWLRKDLRKLFLSHRCDVSIMVEYDRTGAGRSLIQCYDILFHRVVSFFKVAKDVIMRQI